MKNEQFFKIKEGSVIWELIEGEVVIICLENGHYFHLDGLSTSIWIMMEQGESRESIASFLSTNYQKEREEILLDIKAFFQELENENLIESVDKADSIQDRKLPSLAGTAYSPPALKKYTDMADLLLIDPIHEVDEHGWPNRYPLPQNQ